LNRLQGSAPSLAAVNEGDAHEAKFQDAIVSADYAVKRKP
jgi:hypothetical protein